MQISAKKGTGVEDLLEMVALVAEIEQLVANLDKAAEIFARPHVTQVFCDADQRQERDRRG